MYIKSAESNKQNTYFFLFRQVINQTMEVDIP